MFRKIDLARIPTHIGIIMDGNGRWARAKGLSRSQGHRAGVEAIRDVIKFCNEIKVGYLSLYAFSTENWGRPKDEVDNLMKLVIEFLQKEILELHTNNVRICFLGRINDLPLETREEINKSVELTKDNKGLTVLIAINYGGRREIVDAVRELINEGFTNLDDIDENSFSSFLYTKGIPDPDLIIRPSGELRISNYMIWQSAYSELWFSNVLWPDFNRKTLSRAIIDYQSRKRRFGKV